MRPTRLSEQLTVDLLLEVQVLFVQHDFEEICERRGCEVFVDGSLGLA